MDILSFLNSKDIADYLRRIDYEFTAYEMAYVIYWSMNTTLSEKLAAWKAIPQEAPDCVPCCRDTEVFTMSTYELIERYSALASQRLDSFFETEGFWYSLEFPFRGTRNAHYADLVFDSYEECLEYLRINIEYSDSMRERGRDFLSDTTFKIAKRPIGEERGCRRITLNRDLEPINIWPWYTEDEPQDDMEYLLDNGHVKIPIPFQCGDILIDASNGDAKPFVFTSLPFWDSQTLKEHGTSADSEEIRLADDGHEYIDFMNKNRSWDASHMAPSGYANNARFIASPHPCMIWNDRFGAAPNYLNLEYYREPLSQSDRILKVISLFEKHALDIESVINLTCYLTQDSLAGEMRDFFRTQYDDTINGLIDEEVSPFDPIQKS